MSKGNDSRGQDGRAPKGGERGNEPRNAQSPVRMSVERARAIQAHADRTGRNQGFKERAMSAAAKNRTNGSNES